MQNNFNSQGKKYPPINCSNDYQMVSEGIRVPLLQKLNIERSSKESIKSAIKKRNDLIRKNIKLHNQNVIDICILFNESLKNSKLNLTKFILKT